MYRNHIVLVLCLLGFFFSEPAPEAVPLLPGRKVQERKQASGTPGSEQSPAFVHGGADTAAGQREPLTEHILCMQSMESLRRKHVGLIYTRFLTYIR